MYTRRFQAHITTGRLTLPTVILISIVCWVSFAFLTPNTEHISWIDRLSSLIIYGGIGYLLIELNNIFAIIRMRASIQTAIFFLLVSICPSIQTFSNSLLSAITVLLALFFLFRSYQKSHASSDLFYTFGCISIGSLLFPQITLLAPLFWIGSYGFQSLHPKSFFASLIGWSLPYWLLFGHAYFYKDMDLFYQPFQSLINFQPIHFQFQTLEIATLSYLFILFIVSASHCLIAGYEDKIRTRSFLHFLIFFTFCLFLYVLLQPGNMKQILPILLMGTSILAGHLFVLTNNRSSNLFFIGMLIGLCSLIYFHIWMLL